ncbi:hypothetical protein MSG28_009781 [Choristoneura fumiferana]|uniref:Uncharacterized protein n=1 Tax=Choristoneura fumiferana TaxID=7141 RepID=A0ACC0JCG5_CHOFU|nr:hypothetical protein MSG28_009781 [Choristoneura fumiferana]
MHIYNVSRIPSRIIKPMEKTKLIDNGHGYVSAAESILEPPKKNKAANDIVARVIGDFGRWQLRLSIMMALLKFPIGWYQLNILFLAPPQEFWCVKPAAFGSFSVKEWREMCAPRIEEHPCLIFDPEILAMAPAMERAYIPLIECPEFEYDTAVFKRTIVSDFDLVCSRHWLVSFTQVINMCGILTGGLLFGVIADKFGRKTPLMFAICLQAFASFGVCYTTCYCQFIAGSFLLALGSGGTGIISFVLIMEVVSGKWRTIIPVLYQLPFSLANPVMAGLAYWLRDWRKLEFALSCFSASFILYWFCLSESPRWLLATGDTDRAYKVLKKAARLNKREFNRKEVRILLDNAKGKPNKDAKTGLITFMRIKKMRSRAILLSINWFCTGLAFYTFSQYLSSIGDNIFYTVTLTGLISLPGAIICGFVIMRRGRKATLAIFELATALCFICILVIPRDKYPNDWPKLIFAGIGFGGMAGSVPTLYLFSGELFPTVERNIGVTAVSTFGRLGSMVAPVLVSGSKIWQMERSCNCCQESGEREATVDLYCPEAKREENRYRKIVTKAPLECMCRPCGTIDPSSIIPQETVGYADEGPLHNQFRKSF